MISKVLRKSVAIVPWRFRNRIKRIPLIAAAQRWFLYKFIEGKPFVHTVDAGPAKGLHFPVRLPDDKGVWTGTYELEFSMMLSESVKEGDVCFDIGAWRGFFSGLMGLAGAKHVYAFEPLPANIEQIELLITLNPGLPLNLIKAAVGEKSGELDFKIMPATSMGKFAESSFQANDSSEVSLRVPVVSLDDLVECGRLNVPSVIKIDVEGAELLVLRGARKILGSHKPALFIEIHSRVLGQQCYVFLTSLDYQSIRVLETGNSPDFSSEPEVCHFIAFSEPDSFL